MIAGGSGLIDANFFFVDIVGLSDPEMSTKLQTRKLEFLNNAIANCSAFKDTPPKSTLVLPTGDGMAIGFLQGPDLPLRLAIELHQKINAHNKARVPAEVVAVRIGIHKGLVFIINDLKGNRNIWGPGIIIARRIMDVADDGHILLSSRVAEDLRHFSDEYRRMIHALGKIEIKHNRHLFIYSAYGKDFGSSKTPSRLSGRVNEYLYRFIGVNISILNTETMLVHYKRGYEIQATADVPIDTVTHQIATDVDKTFEELGIKVYDEENKRLKISSIDVDKPTQKEFATTFAEPVEKGQRKKYFIEYETEEPARYFKNIFLTNCEKFVVSIDYPDSIGPPICFEMNLEEEGKEICRSKGTHTTNRGRKVSTWEMHDLTKGQAYSFEW